MAEPLLATRVHKRNTGRALKQLQSNRAAMAGMVVILILVVAAIFAPFLAPYNPYTVTLESRLQAPGAAHLLGTDELGRDILSRLLYGARVSLWVGIDCRAGGTHRRGRWTGGWLSGWLG